jgi:acetyl esterase/lipase
MLSLLPACSPVALLNVLAPRVRQTTDVAYAPGPRHGLDIYAPEGRTDAPVVVFFYGGGWTEGDKALYRFVGASLAAEGFVTVIPDYRVYPAVRFPAFLQDAAAALAWVRSSITAYGGDPRKITVMGHSAGAYIAAMLTLDRQWLLGAGLDPDHTISRMIGVSGPYDFLPLQDAELEAIFAPAGDLRLSQPITFARGDAAPMLLVTGSADDTVYPRNTRNLAAAVRQVGGQVQTKIYPGVGHKLIIGAFAGLLRWYAPVFRDVITFLGAAPAAPPRQAWRPTQAVTP